MNYNMSLQNKLVWEFYDEHKNLNFEDMNILFVQIMQKLIENSNPSFNINVVSQLLENVKNLQTQVSNVTDMFSKNASDMNTNFTMKFMEFKREYVEDLKMILSSNTSDKVAPIIKEYNDTLLDKTRIMINEIIPKNHETITKDIENSIKNLHSSINQDTNTLLKSSVGSVKSKISMSQWFGVFSVFVGLGLEVIMNYRKASGKSKTVDTSKSVITSSTNTKLDNNRSKSPSSPKRRSKSPSVPKRSKSPSVPKRSKSPSRAKKNN